MTEHLGGAEDADATVAIYADWVEATAELADDLHLPPGELQQNILDLLAEKKQLIFYGPPGIGKTFVAQRIGRHLAESGGHTRLVQFHHSYTYEDFFEGTGRFQATTETSTSS